MSSEVSANGLHSALAQALQRLAGGATFMDTKQLGEKSVGEDFFSGRIWWFPKIVVSQNGWFKMENSIKMDDLGVPLFLETPI